MSKTHADVITASVNDICRMSGLSRGTIYKLINEKKIASTKVGGRRLVIVDSYRKMVEDQPEG